MAWGSGSLTEGAGWGATCRLALLEPSFLVANALDDPDSDAAQSGSANPFSFGAATRMRAGRSATPF